MGGRACERSEWRNNMKTSNIFKKRRFIAFGAALACAATTSLQAQSGSSTIQAPVTSGFGTYIPYPVARYSVTGGLSEPTISPDFSNVAASESEFPWGTYFSSR